MDTLFETKRQQLLAVLQLNETIEFLLRTYPAYNTLPLQASQRMCAMCNKAVGIVQLKMLGEPYDPTTLTGRFVPPTNLKEFIACKPCECYADMYSKLVHLKRNYCRLCSTKVERIRNTEYNVETNDLLQRVLQQEWLDKLFHGLQEFCAEIEWMAYKSGLFKPHVPAS